MRSDVRILGYLVLGLSLVLCGPSVYGMEEQSSTQINFVWKSYEESVLTREKQFLASNGAKINKFNHEEPSAGIGPAGAALLILAGSAAVCVLAQAILRALQKSHGGLELSIQNDKIAIDPREDMTHTEVIIRKKDGTEIRYMTKGKAQQDLCNILTSVLRPSQT